MANYGKGDTDLDKEYESQHNIRFDGEEGKPTKEEHQLYVAANNGDDKQVRELLAKGVNVDGGKNADQTPLFRACLRGYTHVVNTLLEAGADINRASKTNNSTPLAIACQNGREAVLMKLLPKGVDLHTRSGDFNSPPLLLAAMNNQIGCVKQLLDYGCDVNQTDPLGKTALFEACIGGHVPLTKKLLAAGSAVNTLTDDRESPLYIACKSGSEDIVKLLLEHDAEPNTMTKAGLAPLHVAASKGHVGIVRLLVAHPTTNTKLRTAQTIFDLAAHFETKAIIKTLNTWKEQREQESREKLVKDWLALQEQKGKTFSKEEAYKLPESDLWVELTDRDIEHKNVQYSHLQNQGSIVLLQNMYSKCERSYNKALPPVGIDKDWKPKPSAEPICSSPLSRQGASTITFSAFTQALLSSSSPNPSSSTSTTTTSTHQHTAQGVVWHYTLESLANPDELQTEAQRPNDVVRIKYNIKMRRKQKAYCLHVIPPTTNKMHTDGLTNEVEVLFQLNHRNIAALVHAYTGEFEPIREHLLQNYESEIGVADWMVGSNEPRMTPMLVYEHIPSCQRLSSYDKNSQEDNVTKFCWRRACLTCVQLLHATSYLQSRLILYGTSVDMNDIYIGHDKRIILHNFSNASLLTNEKTGLLLDSQILNCLMEGEELFQITEQAIATMNGVVPNDKVLKPQDAADKQSYDKAIQHLRDQMRSIMEIHKLLADQNDEQTAPFKKCISLIGGEQGSCPSPRIAALMIAFLLFVDTPTEITNESKAGEWLKARRIEVGNRVLDGKWESRLYTDVEHFLEVDFLLSATRPLLVQLANLAQ